jgi:hypothetical protein
MAKLKQEVLVRAFKMILIDSSGPNFFTTFIGLEKRCRGCALQGARLKNHFWKRRCPDITYLAF